MPPRSWLCSTCSLVSPTSLPVSLPKREQELTSGSDYVRPKIGSALAIRNGRHPILETTLPHGAVIPNDVYAADGPADFQLIQGPKLVLCRTCSTDNSMSGKSTYLRQIGLLTVQGMVGCL